MFTEARRTSSDKNIPSKWTKGKRHLPWVSALVKRHMHSRDRTYRKAKRTAEKETLLQLSFGKIIRLMSMKL